MILTPALAPTRLISQRHLDAMFAVNYEDGRTAYMVVENHGKPSDDYLAGPISKLSPTHSAEITRAMQTLNSWRTSPSS